MQYEGEAYCWQVAPQQSLIPLPLHGVNIQLSNAIVTNYFLQHYQIFIRPKSQIPRLKFQDPNSKIQIPGRITPQFTLGLGI